MHKPNTARRRPPRLAAASSALLASGLALAGCSSEPEANNPAEGPTATATSTATATVAFTGEACSYDGPTEFEVDSTVTFTVTNETDIAETEFAVWKVPEGTTPEEIYGGGFFSVVPQDNAHWIVFEPTAQGEAYDLPVTFEEPGQHGIVCWGPGNENYMTMLTVKEPTPPFANNELTTEAAASWTYTKLNGRPVTITYDPEDGIMWATDADGEPTVPVAVEYIDSLALGGNCYRLGLEYAGYAYDAPRERMSAYAQLAADRAEDAGCSGVGSVSGR